MKASPLPYQERSIEEIDRFKGRVLLASEMGLGKTLTSLWWWERNIKTHPGIVVCPASVKWVWEREASNNLGIQPHVIERRKPYDLPKNSKLVIINYDILQHWCSTLKQFGFKTVFYDECHYLKNGDSKRTKAANRLSKGIKNVFALSGTPLMNRPVEMISVLQMLDPGTWDSGYEFREEFCKPRWTPWGIKYDGASNTERLHRLLKASCMVRYKKKDVLKELPDKIRRVVPLPLSNEDEYRQATDDFISWLKEKYPKKVKRAKKAEILVKLGYLKRLAAKLKLRAAVDWINEWLEEYPDEKLVVFAVHRKMIEALKRRIQTKSVVVDGSVSGRKRQAAVDRFQEDSKTRCFVGNIRAAGVGLTLTAASTVVNAELDWVPAVHTQAEDRVHRIGQANQCWIWYLVAASTIEEDLCEILQKKQRVVQAVLDGEVVDDLDVYDQLLKKMGRRLT